VEHLPGSDPVKGYMATAMELDMAMESLLRDLEEAGIADDTVIVMATDHYPYGLEPSDAWGNHADYLAELYGQPISDCFIRDRSSLIIWSGCLEDREPIVVDTPVYSLDILPTLSNLFGVEYDSRLLAGRDVFSDAEPLVLWTNHSWVTDKGYFNASKATFTPREGVEVEEGYVDRIKARVSNTIQFSKSVQTHHYYDVILEALGRTE
jgi:lipoteichoic acid synthase